MNREGGTWRQVAAFLCRVTGVLLGVAVGAGTPLAVAAGEPLTVTAQVVAVDWGDRSLILRGADGKVACIEVSPEVRSMDHVRLGNRVRVTYHEAVVVYIGKAGEQSQAPADRVVAMAGTGDNPAGVLVETVEMSARVHGLDRLTRTLSLQGPAGNVLITRVDAAVKAFDTLQVGDVVDARFTEAVAVSVERL